MIKISTTKNKHWRLRLLFFTLLTALSTHLLAQNNYYWVGGDGQWDDLTHWASSSGGAGGAYGSVPTSADNVYFDAGSGFNSGDSVRVVLADVSCNDIDWTGAANNPVFYGEKKITIYGSLTLAAVMVFKFDLESIRFSSTNPGNTITTNGNALYSPVYFEGTGEWILQDALYVDNNLFFSNGHLNTNNRHVTCDRFKSFGSNACTLTLGASLFEVNKSGGESSHSWEILNSSFLTLDAGTSTILFNGTGPEYTVMSAGDHLDYYNVRFMKTGKIYTESCTYNKIEYGIGSMGSGYFDGDNNSSVETIFYGRGSILGDNNSFTDYAEFYNDSWIRSGDNDFNEIRFHRYHSFDVANVMYLGPNTTQSVTADNFNLLGTIYCDHTVIMADTAGLGGATPAPAVLYTDDVLSLLYVKISRIHAKNGPDPTGIGLAPDTASQSINNNAINWFFDEEYLKVDTIITENVNPCNYSHNGQIQVNMSGALGTLEYRIYKYGIPLGTWQSSSLFTSLDSGYYTVHFRENRSGTYCYPTETLDSIHIYAPPVIVIDSTQSIDALCHGDCSGKIIVFARGDSTLPNDTIPLYYSGDYGLSGGSNFSLNDTISGLCAGDHPIMVRDENGCLMNWNGSVAIPDTVATGQPDTIIMSPRQHTVTCYGLSDGWADFEISGGTTPYTHHWETGSTDARIEDMPAGMYTDTVTDANGCIAIDSVQIFQPDSLIVTFATGTDLGPPVTYWAKAIPSGGKPPYTHWWTDNVTAGGNARTQDSIYNLLANTYIDTVTDDRGCQAWGSVVLQTLDISIDSSNISCFGGSDGWITATALGGNTPYTYEWINLSEGGAVIGTDATITNLDTGTYKITITDAAPVQKTRTVILTQPAAPLSLTAVVDSIECYSETNGAINITVAGGTPTTLPSPHYDYQWTYQGAPFSTDEDLSNLDAGVYSLLVTDSLGCIIDTSFTVYEPDSIIVRFAYGNNDCSSTGYWLRADVSGGTEPFTYHWTPHAVSGSNTDSIYNIEARDYRLHLEDANGCTLHTDTTFIIEALAISIDSSNITCFGGNDGWITAGLSGGIPPFSYEWTPGTPSGYTTDSAYNLSAGSYTLTVTDSSNCPHNRNVTLAEPTELEITNVASTNITGCQGDANGIITITTAGGTPIIQYSIDGGSTWSNGNSFVGLTAGNYNVQVKDANNCTTVYASNPVVLTEPSGISITDVEAIDPSCNGFTNGSITITASGGTGDLRYSINDGTSYQFDDPIFTGLSSGSYTIRVRDDEGCETTWVSNPVILTDPAVLSNSFSNTNPTCAGCTDGEITSSPAGGTAPYNHSWNTGASTATINGLVAGVYYIDTITDSHGCQILDSTILTEPGQFLISIDSSIISCNGYNDGWIEATVSGGTTPYTYAWKKEPDPDVVSTNALANNLTAGTYSLIVTDAFSYKAYDTVTLTEPNPIAISFTLSSDSICVEDSSAWILASVTGGTAPYSYNWSSGDVLPANPDSIFNLYANTYTLNITDDSACMASADTVIYNYGVPVADFTSDTVCFGNPSHLTDLSNGTDAGLYSWHWFFGDGTDSLITIPDSPDIEHTYATAGKFEVRLVVHNLNGCISDTIADSVLVNNIPVVNFTNDTACFGNLTTFTDMSSASAPASLVNWSWKFPNGTSTDQNPAHIFDSWGLNEVQLTVADNIGCSDSLTKMVLVDSLPVPNFSYDDNCTGNFVSFTNESIGNGSTIASNYWDFGDLYYSSEVNPIHYYETWDTTFLVSLTVTNNRGCRDSISDSVFVSTPIGVDFTFDTVCFGDSTHFYDTTIIANDQIESINWFFGDGSQDTVHNPAHQYPYPGQFSVTLLIVDTAGCSSSVSHTVIVDSLPNVDFEWTRECFGDSTVFTNLSDGADTNLIDWTWHFGDDSTSTLFSPKHLYQAPGEYLVTLRTTNYWGCSDSISHLIIVDSLPQANFAFTLACLGDSTIFSDSSLAHSDPGLTNWFWDFGDGSNSTLQNPKHLFGSSGDFPVQLTVTNSLGCMDDSTQTVTVYPLPVANFEADSVCFGDSTHFTSLSNGSGAILTSWYWQFGDDSTSTEEHPVHLYQAAGTYAVTLSVTNANGCQHDTTINILVRALPQADFDYSQACIGDTTHFTDQSLGVSGNIVSWDWSFGDGGTAAIQNPSHYYANEGLYDVQLIVVTEHGCSDTIIQPVQVDTLPTADFSYSASCIDRATHFYDESDPNNGAIVSWQWDIDNIWSSTVQNPTYAFNTHGNHTVQLIVANSHGCSDTVVQTVFTDSLPDAEFTYTSGCLGTVTEFTDLTDPTGSSIDSWTWYFGDGATSTEQNPGHTYAASGSYNVKLVVVKPMGCADSVVHSVFIDSIPDAAFSADTVCFGYATQFTESSTSHGTLNNSWHYYFGDGTDTLISYPNYIQPAHTYPAPGIYSAMLIVGNQNTCLDTAYLDVMVDTLPEPAFSYTQACFGDTTWFTDLSTPNAPSLNNQNWDFGDGNTGTGANPYNLYGAPGTYTVWLSIENSNGCVDSISQEIVVDSLPVADFSAPQVCLGNETPFSDLSYDGGANISNWDWNFGDGNTSMLQNPIHTYATADTFLVSLSVINLNGCTDDTTMKIVVDSLPVANFTFDTACYGLPTTFTDLSSPHSANLASWYWHFDDPASGDDSTSTLQNPAHIFSAPGTYNVMLIIANNNSCEDTVYHEVLVNPGAVAEFTNDTTCFGNPTHFTDESYGITTDIVAWSWDFGDGNSSTLQNPEYTFANWGIHLVELTVTDENGCLGTIQHNVVVDSLPFPGFTYNNQCVGEVINFTDTSLANGSPIVSWYWDFGDGHYSTQQNPTHIFTTHSPFTVTLTVTSARGCSDSISQIVLMNPPFDIDFSADSVCFGLETHFNDELLTPGTIIVSRNWDFGDGNTGSGEDPVHTYALAGNYNVMLTATDDWGCTKTVNHIIPVYPNPEPDFDYTTPCEGLSTEFTDLTPVTGSGIASRLWKFGDGTTSTEQNPSHTYLNDDIYEVWLIIENGNGCIDSVSQNVPVYSVPVADFNTTHNCIGQPTHFIDNSSSPVGNIISWAWDFGDGNTSTDQNPTHYYAAAGDYTVELIVSNVNSCTDTITKTVSIYPPPTADFSAAPLCLNNPTQFTDLSTSSGGNIVSWSWDFGDGYSSNDQNPAHTYAASGDYDVHLIVTDEEGCTNDTTKTITVYHLPAPNFTYINACENDTTYFFDASAPNGGSITSRLWKFGDGTTSTDENPWHIYALNGTYDVTLIISNSDGCTDSIVKQVEVLPPPMADFNADSVCFGEPTHFYDNSSSTSGNINSWIWTFGDGGGSTNQNPVHTYAAYGIYDVQLIVTNANGCRDTVIKEVVVHQLPVVEFESDEACLGDSTHFTDLSTSGGNLSSWFWEFGDGNTSSDQNPVHLFASAGTFNTTLTVSDEFGCQSDHSENVIVHPLPVAAFSFNSVTCSNDTIFFTDESSSAAGVNSWLWDFGDGATSTAQNPWHIFPAGGSNFVTLTVTDGNGCVNSITHELNIAPPPEADFEYSGTCASMTTQFTDLSSTIEGTIIYRHWNFGDPASGIYNTSELQNPTHTYTTEGDYQVQLIVRNTAGCEDTLVQTITIDPDPDADFTFNNPCAHDTSYFADASAPATAPINAWFWEFGDGHTSSDQNPWHLYTTSGQYMVSLTVTDDNGCANTETKMVVIYPLPTALFQVEPSCAGLITHFTDYSNGGGADITNWYWDFGDPTSGANNYSTAQNPTHIFSTAGLYNVTLTVVNAHGCSNATTLPIEVLNAPVADFEADTACKGTPTYFNNLSYDIDDVIVSWYWDFGDGSTSTLQYPYHTYDEAGTYIVSLVVTNSIGCTDNIAKEVVVHHNPQVEFSYTDPSCFGDSIQFFDETYFTGSNMVDNWLWYFGDGDSSTLENPKHYYELPGMYVVTLQVYDTSGCFGSKQKEIYIHEPPAANFSWIVQNCDSAYFTDLSYDSDTTIVHWQWNFGDPASGSNNVSNDTNPVHQYLIGGDYEVNLIVTSAHGCIDSITKTVNVSMPDAGFTVDSATLCKNTATQFYDNSNPNGDYIVSWLWDFGDGTTSTQENPTHNYANAGNYYVSLIVTNSQGCEDTETHSVQINHGPLVDFEYSYPNCLGDSIHFTDLTNTYGGVPITSWFWDFGDGNTSTEQNPGHIYTSSGTYNVSLTVNDASNCPDYLVKPVYVSPLPMAHFEHTITGCDTVHFTDLSTDIDTTIVAWYWNFDDPASGYNNISTNQHPVHVFHNAGDYDVSLIVTNALGCQDTVNQTVSIYRPEADFSMSNDSSCMNIEVYFTDESETYGDVTVSWLWEFGDGQTSTAPNPSHSYNDYGVFDVSLTITTAYGCSDVKVLPVYIYPGPDAEFSMEYPSCLDDSIQFFNESSGAGNMPLVGFYWEFGDGSTSTEENPAHEYVMAGEYFVTLEVTDERGCTSQVSHLLTVSERPMAGFNYDVHLCDTVFFEDASEDNDTTIVAWFWDFGDPLSIWNNQSTLQNPSHAYHEEGNYTVTLIATNAYGCRDTVQDIITIIRPEADFTVNDDSVCLGTAIAFEDISDPNGGNIIDWFWDFDDGNTANVQNISHVYDEPGTYYVSLTITNSLGCQDNKVKPVHVFYPPVAQFTYDDVTCLGDSIHFENESYTTGVNSIVSYNWNFGDGSTSTEENPVHYFDDPGSYFITLTITDDAGCIDVASEYIEIYPAPFGNFNFQTVDCDTTYFTDETIDNNAAITSWYWDFDDPASGWQNYSTAQNPSHRFLNAGNYDVQLIVTNALGCVDTVLRTVSIHLPTAEFSTDVVCAGLPTTFTDESSGNGSAIVSWFWEFGDGGTSSIQNPSHNYANSGIFLVSLTVSNNAGCISQKTEQVVVNHLPIANFTHDAPNCNGLPVQFTDASSMAGGTAITSWNWDFGDGFTSTEQNPSHLYNAPGSYFVILSVEGANGCGDDTTMTVTIYPTPDANFVYDIVNCDTTYFTDISSGGGADIIFREWNFDDPASGFFNTSNEQNPWHVYETAGTYNVQLIVTNTNYCKDTIVKPLIFDPLPIPQFEFDTACFGDSTHFTNLSTGPNIILYEWTFGDGFFSYNENPVHKYTAPGTYNVTLRVTNSMSCVDSITHEVIVNPLPDVAFTTSDSVCFGNSVNFFDQTIPNADSISSWLWNFGDGSTATVQNPTHDYASGGSFVVSLTVTNSNGCVDSAVQAVFVNPLPIADFTFDSACLGYPTQFFDQSTSEYSYIVNWQWDFGDGSDTLGLPNPPHVYENYGDFDVTLIVGDLLGCTDTITKEVHVHQPPTADFTVSSDTICLGDTTFFIDQSIGNEAGIASWNWYFGEPSSGAADSSELQNPIHVYDTAGTYYVLLIVTDSNGCVGDILKPVVVNPNPIANFTYSAACSNEGVEFIDLSAINQDEIVSWNWNFGDGETSTEQNPIHFYDPTNVDTTYSVTLTVQALNGCIDSVTQDVSITAAPVADFSYADACLGYLVDFTDLSSTYSGMIVDWQWDFGDGATSSQQHPYHLYALADTFDVQLIVTNSWGCVDTTVKSVIIHNLPLPEFEADTVCFGDTTHFTDLSFSEGEVSEWLWHFGDPYSGDNDTSTLQNPEHWYTRAGIFNVTLEVADTNGCRTSIMQQVLVNPLPVAEFHFESATCQNQAIDFEDRSYSPGGAIHEWHWDFGDGTVITIYHPGNPDVSHTYTEQGNFTVGLTVVDTNGCSEYTEHYITVYPLPTANFTFSDTACEASLIYFQDSSLAQNTQLKSWFWDLNYPNQYYSPLQNPYFYYPETDMTYTVMLAIEDQHGCVDTIFKQVYVKKGFEIDFLADTVCFGTPTSFTDSVLSPAGDSLINWSWNFGDGATSSEESPQHIFDDPGMHFVSLQANNQDGCPATATKEILVYALPEPAFSAAPAGCEDSTVFEDLSLYQSDSVNSWTWRFGDGTDTTILWPDSPDVFHFYPPQDSTYLATLIIENSRGCIDSIQQDVVRYPCLFVDFGEEGVLCDGQTATFRDYSFTGSEDVQMLDWEWFFGDGNSVYYTEQQDTLYHTYAAPGTYMVELVIRAEGNNGIVSDTSRHEVVVYNSPQSEFNFDKFCVKAPTEFTDYSFVDFGEIDRWYWNFGDGFTSRLQNPQHVYFQDSVYEVQLVTQTTNGCTDTVKHNLEIHALPEVYLVPDENRGCGDSLRFTFRDTSAQQHEVYRWTFDDDELVNTDEDFISKLFYYGEHEVKLRVTSPWGCINRDSASIELTRKPIAGFHLYSDSISILNPRVRISDESESMDALIEYWHYSMGNGYDTLARTFDYMYSDTGHYHIEQIVQDYNGCRDSISHKVFIYPELTFHIANAFTPNGDGVNATFKPQGRYFEDKAYNFQIFNRWGQSIFETFDYNEAWDGTFNGEPAPVGLYTWIITVTDTWGVTYTYNGYVVLIR